MGRLVSYKRPDLVVKAFEGLGYPLVVVGEGHLADLLRATAPPNVTFLGAVDDAALRDLYRSARALVYPAEEDFGITMAEAHRPPRPRSAEGMSPVSASFFESPDASVSMGRFKVSRRAIADLQNR